MGNGRLYFDADQKKYVFVALRTLKLPADSSGSYDKGNGYIAQPEVWYFITEREGHLMMAQIEWVWTPYMLAGAITSLIALTLMAMIRGRRGQGRGAGWFMIMLAAISLWCAMEVVIIGVLPLEAKLVCIRVQYLGILTMSPTFFCFSSAYTSNKIFSRKSFPAFLFGLQFISLIVILTNESHHLFWRSITLKRVGDFYGTRIEYGPWFLAHSIFQYALVFAGTVMLIWRLGQSQKRFTLQIMTVVSTVVMVAAGNLLYLFKGQQMVIDPTPAAMALSSGLLFLALYRFRLFDLVPVARSAVIASMSDAVLALDEEDRLVDMNPAAEALIALTPAQAIGRSLTEILPGVSLPVRTDSTEVEWTSHEGERRIYDVRQTLLGSHGELRQGRLLVLRDITERKRNERELAEARAALELANQKLQTLAHTDELTGLSNRRYFMIRLREEIARTHRSESPLGLVMLDLDHFKRINDTHGHAIGDEVLVLVAEALKTVKRESDIAARLGGEELALLLPQTDASGAIQVAQRIQNAISSSASSASLQQRGLTITASLGVAALCGAELEESRLMAIADERLYQAKNDGRNCIRG
ncbi:MAG: diguanylate cyclase [Acidobacteria bacterium]|nr:diguanylate cyclase [Acidobacteriota bacterium]